MSVQVSIDGFRLIAERTGNYAGQDEPEFVMNEQNQMIAAKVTVYKFSPSGQRYPAAVGVAYWGEYAQNSPMWSKMPRTMLAKCAEALALRKAFPQELSGLYTSEEMLQAEPQSENKYTITDKDLDYLERLFENTSLEPESPDYKSIRLHIDNPHMITAEKHTRIKAKLEQSKKNPIHNQSYSQEELTSHIKNISQE
jgi:hypothetical protein